VDAVDDLAADVIDPVLVEGDDECGDEAVGGDDVAAKQGIGQHTVADAGRRLLVDDLIQQRLDLDAALVVAVAVRRARL
jgi:hypothetical protein